MSVLAESGRLHADAPPQPLEYFLLGPLVVWRSGRAIRIQAAKQRVVLAALLLHSCQVVTVDELTDAVWGGRPPASARATLQNYIMRLRAAIGDADRSLIITRPRGYQINVGDELDLARFDTLQRKALQAARNGAWGEASERLHSALALWRGEPLSDVPSDVLVFREQPRLREMHTQALEARIDADIRLGLHAAVIAELQCLTAAQPLRERPHAQLMLALYRDGRQAEALAAYRRARDLLVSELGVEPGPELRDLHQRILAADPSLMGCPPAVDTGRPTLSIVLGSRVRTQDPPTHAAAAGAALAGPTPAPPVLPRQLPAAVRHFAGRQAQLAALTALLDEAADTVGTVVISAIGGTAGIGKTALAVHWAHQVADRFPDGQLYVNLRGFDPSGTPVSPADAVRGFLDALQVPPDQVPPTLAGQTAMYRSMIASKRMLIVLDNARDTEHVRPLLPGSPGRLVLVTSRSQLAGLIAAEGAHPITLDLLTEADAYELMASRLGAERVRAEPGAVDEIIQLCSRLPLALSIAAGRAATHPSFPLAALAAELRDAGGRLDILDAGEPETNVRTVLSWSYRSLLPAAARMFRLLGSHPGPDTSTYAAASLASLPAGQARQLLGKLTAAGLLTEHTPGRYAFHDLLRAYAAEQASATDSAADRLAAIHRLADHYVHTGNAADRLLYPTRMPIALLPAPPGTQPEHLSSEAAALEWFGTEHHVLLAMLGLAARHRLDSWAWRLAWTMETFFYRRGQWHDWAATQRTALAAAQRIGDIEGQACAHRGIGSATIELGAFDKAQYHLSEAQRFFEQAGNRTGEARVHLDMARLFCFQGREEQALPCGRKALRIFRAVGSRAGEAAALNELGWTLCQMGAYEEAIAYCEQAIAVCEETGDRHSEAPTWDSLGYAHHHLGHHAQATACYRRAVEIMSDQGHTHQKAYALHHAGDVHHEAGDKRAARGAWQDALAILENLHHPDAQLLRAKLAGLGVSP
jgi:DNA-binding SARP family transcriptional activator/tetratricopeptide (TPR) repeat protein